MGTAVDTSVYPYRRHTWVLTTGNYWDAEMYRLTAVPLTLEVIPTPAKDPAAVMRVLTAEAAAPGRLPG